MTFRPGISDNPSGGKKGPRSLAVRIRSMAEKDAVEIVKAVIEGAKLGDVECRRLYLKFLLPLPRVISTPVDLPPAMSNDDDYAPDEDAGRALFEEFQNNARAAAERIKYDPWQREISPRRSRS